MIGMVFALKECSLKTCFFLPGSFFGFGGSETNLEGINNEGFSDARASPDPNKGTKTLGEF
jgi:hypothetical protein